MAERMDATDTVMLAQQARGTAKSVDSELLDTLFIGLLRSPTLFDDARRFIKTNQFTPEELHYGHLWRMLCDLREQYDRFSGSMVLTHVKRELSHNPGLIHPAMQQKLLHLGDHGLIFAAFSAKPEEIDTTYCRQLMREFLMERTVYSPLRQMMAPIDNGLFVEGVDDFLLQTLGQRDRIMSIDELPTEDPMPPVGGTIEQPAPPFPTGLGFIDDAIGGVSAGCVYGLLGVTGAGKTTLGFHLATSMAQNEYVDALEEGRQPGLVAYLSYEESAARLRPRLWSAACQIPRDSLAAMSQPDAELAREVNPNGYEKRLSGEGTPKSEYERWQMARPWLSACTRIFDMSGSGKHPNSGTGFIDEIVAVLEGWSMRNKDQPIAVPIIDYAGLCCKRYMRSHNLDDSRLRGFLSSFGDECRHKIAERFGCPVWVLHQIAPSEAQKNPTTPLHHSQAAESRAFAENMVACGCIGVPDADTGNRRLNWSKLRDKKAEGQPPFILQVHEDYARMIDVTSRYGVANRKFVSAEMARQLEGVADPGMTTPLQANRVAREIAGGAS